MMMHQKLMKKDKGKLKKMKTLLESLQDFQQRAKKGEIQIFLEIR